MDKFVNFWKNSTTGIKIGVFAMLLMPIVILLVTLISLLIPEDMGNERLLISNYYEVANAPKEYLFNIQNIILNAIGQKLGDNETVYTDVAIRDGSYSETEFNNVKTVKMIVDVPSIRQSFAIQFNYHKNARNYDDPDVNVGCPYYTDVIYTDTKCIAASPYTQIERYLPRYDYVGGVKYGVSLKKYNGKSYLAVEAPACGNTDILNSAQSSFENWIESVYLDKADYDIQVVDTCR